MSLPLWGYHWVVFVNIGIEPPVRVQSIAKQETLAGVLLMVLIDSCQ